MANKKTQRLRVIQASARKLAKAEEISYEEAFTRMRAEASAAVRMGS